jgi:hypothetical protein
MPSPPLPQSSWPLLPAASSGGSLTRSGSGGIWRLRSPAGSGQQDVVCRGGALCSFPRQQGVPAGPSERSLSCRAGELAAAAVPALRASSFGEGGGGALSRRPPSLNLPHASSGRRVRLAGLLPWGQGAAGLAAAGRSSSCASVSRDDTESHLADAGPSASAPFDLISLSLLTSVPAHGSVRPCLRAPLRCSSPACAHRGAGCSQERPSAGSCGGGLHGAGKHVSDIGTSRRAVLGPRARYSKIAVPTSSGPSVLASSAATSASWQ